MRQFWAYTAPFKEKCASWLFWSKTFLLMECTCSGLQAWSMLRLINMSLIHYFTSNGSKNISYYKAKQRQTTLNHFSPYGRVLVTESSFGHGKSTFFKSLIWNPFPSPSLQQIQLHSLFEFSHQLLLSLPRRW